MDYDRVHQHALAVAYTLLVVGAPVLFSEAVIYPFSSPKLAVVGFACGLAALSLALGSDRLRSSVGPTWVLLLAALVLATFSLAVSPVPGVSFWGRHHQEVGYLAIVASLSAYAMGVAVVSLLSRWPNLGLVILIPAVPLALLAIAAAVGAGVPVWMLGRDGSAPVLTFGNPTHAAAFFAAAAVLTLSAGAMSLGRRRILLWACCVLLLATTVLSGSFAAILALVVAGVWVGWRQLGGRGHLRWWLLLGAILVTVGGIVAALSIPNTPFTRAFDVAAGIRPQTYWIALKAIVTHPLVGVGPANFQSALLSQLTPGLVQSTYYAQIAADAHNWILETAATYGLPFAALLTWLFLGPLIRGRGRSPSQEPFAAATLALVVAYLFGPLALSTLPLLALFAGMTAARPERDASRMESIRASGLVRYVRPVLLVLTAVLLFTCSAQFLRATYEVRQGNLYSEASRVKSAAEGLIPILPDPFWTAGSLAAFEGRALNDVRQAEEVDRLFARAKTLDPREPLTELEWAMALQMLERHDDAIAHLQEAMLIYPDWPLALKGIAFSYLDTGRTTEALPILERLHDLYPDDPTVIQLLDQARSALQ